MATKKKLLQAAAGAAGGEALNVEDVFSTYLYTGNGTSQTITNGIDLDGEGGAVIFKSRTTTEDWHTYDTERGTSKRIALNQTTAQYSGASTYGLTAFNSDGFSVGSTGAVNGNGIDLASWTFRKAPKFFDVVTYTGNGSSQVINHNLGTTIGSIIIKRTDSAFDWKVYHRSLGTSQELELNQTAAAASTGGTVTAVSSSSFTVGGGTGVNASGGTYVAYLFAHNDGDGDFGPTGDQDIIKCGSYTGSSSDQIIDLGFEPQWVMIKRYDGSDNWYVLDVMRGVSDTSSQELNPNLSAAETTDVSLDLLPQPNGFKVFANTNIGYTNDDYIYIAIRRGPMAVPTDATDVFTARSHTGSGSTQEISLNHDADVILSKGTSSSNQKWLTTARLFGKKRWTDFSTDADLTAVDWDKNEGYYANADTATESFSGTYWGSSYIHYIFKRAPEVVDFVVYTGTGSNQTIKHNLGVAPDFMLVSGKNDGASYHSSIGATKSFDVNQSGVITSSTVWQNTAPTATEFYVGSAADVNSSTEPFGALLLANKAGLVSVGTYTGNGTSQTIDCGFSSGARFVMLRETGTAYWYIFDTAHGIVAGDDDYFLGLTTAENHDGVADLIDPVSSGFIVNRDTGVTINTNNNFSTYIYVAIA